MASETKQCDAVSEDGDECIVAAGHDGPHMRRPCDGTCDTCDCDFWDDATEDDDDES